MVFVTFFRGTSLPPVPSGASKHEHVRSVDIHQDGFDETQMTPWVKQAEKLQGLGSLTRAHHSPARELCPLPARRERTSEKRSGGCH